MLNRNMLETEEVFCLNDYLQTLISQKKYEDIWNVLKVYFIF